MVNGVLVVYYYENLQEIKETVVKTIGRVTQDTFSFPGGKRFQFKDITGNELAVWLEI